MKSFQAIFPVFKVCVKHIIGGVIMLNHPAIESSSQWALLKILENLENKLTKILENLEINLTKFQKT